MSAKGVTLNLHSADLGMVLQVCAVPAEGGCGGAAEAPDHHLSGGRHPAPWPTLCGLAHGCSQQGGPRHPTLTATPQIQLVYAAASLRAGDHLQHASVWREDVLSTWPATCGHRDASVPLCSPAPPGTASHHSLRTHCALTCQQCTQGYELGCKHAEMLLDIVAQLALVPCKDPYPSESDQPKPDTSSQPDSYPQGVAKQGLPAADILVRVISFRAGYGGMSGDMAMLRAYAHTWQQRCGVVALACTVQRGWVAGEQEHCLAACYWTAWESRLPTCC